MKVKILTGKTWIILESKINDFLYKNKIVNIKDIKFLDRDELGYYTGIIIYSL